MLEIKTKLVVFSENTDKLNENMSPNEALDMMGRNTAINLADEIRKVIKNIAEPEG